MAHPPEHDARGRGHLGHPGGLGLGLGAREEKSENDHRDGEPGKRHDRSSFRFQLRSGTGFV